MKPISVVLFVMAIAAVASCALMWPMQSACKVEQVNGACK